LASWAGSSALHTSHSPKAKQINNMMLTPPPLFQSSDDDSTIFYHGDGRVDVGISKEGDNVDSSQKDKEYISILHK
jgi:hypothetical protein